MAADLPLVKLKQSSFRRSSPRIEPAGMRWPVQYYLGRVQLEREVQRAKEMAAAAAVPPTMKKARE